MLSQIKAILTPHVPYLLKELSGEDIKRYTSEIDRGLEVIRKELSQNPPDVILICSPHFGSKSFTISKHKFYMGDMSPFQRPDIIEQRYGDIELASLILKKGEESGYLAPENEVTHNRLDYGTVVALKLIDPSSKIPIIPVGISTGNLKEHISWGEILKRIIDESDKKVTFIASTELAQDFKDIPTAYPSKELHKFDLKVIDSLLTHDEETLLSLPSNYLKFTEYDLRPVYMLFGYTKELEGTLVSYSGFIGTGCALLSFS